MKKTLFLIISILCMSQAQAQNSGDIINYTPPQTDVLPQPVQNNIKDISTQDINNYNFWFRPNLSRLKFGVSPALPKVFLGNLHIDTLSKGILNRIFLVSNLNNTSDLNKPLSSAAIATFNTKFDKAGGQITGNALVSGSVVAGSSFQLDSKFLATSESGSNSLNARLIGNTSGTDGMYLGYANNLSQSTRIYDGGTTNNIALTAGQLNTNGIAKFLFGNQTDDGTFAQFSGAVKMKSGLGIDGNLELKGNIKVPSGAFGGAHKFDFASQDFASRTWKIRNDNINYGDFSIQQSNNQTDEQYTTRLYISSTGNVGIGITAPTSKLQVVGLLPYADNQTATAAGLTVGAFYRTSTGVLMVVF